MISDKTILIESGVEMEKPEIKPEEDRKKKIDIKIQMILKEIIDSEKKYVKTLTTIVEVQGLVKIDKQVFERWIDFHLIHNFEQNLTPRLSGC